MPLSDLVFDESYLGTRFVYGLTHRPAAYANVPDGRIIGADHSDARFPMFGTIEYPRQLTTEEVKGFELVDVAKLEAFMESEGFTPSMRQLNEWEMPSETA